MGLAEGIALALADPSTVGAWNFQETSGTFDDQSPTNQQISLASRGAYGGPALIPGAARSLQCNGDVGSGSAATSGTLSSSSPLNFTTGKFAIHILYNVEALRTVAHGIFERVGLMGLRLSASSSSPANQIQSFLTIAGTQRQVNSNNGLPLGTNLVSWRWREPYMDLLVNGAHDARGGPWNGTFVQNLTVALLLGYGSQTIDGAIQALVCQSDWRSDGEIRTLSRAFDTALDRSGGEVIFDDLTPPGDTVAAATSRNALCHVTGGHMKASEPRRTPSDGRPRRPRSRIVEIAASPAEMTAASTQAQWEARYLDVITTIFRIITTRGYSTKTTYHDGTSLRSPELDAAGRSGNKAGLGSLAAIVARHIEGGASHPNGLPHPTELVNFARSDLAYLHSISELDPPGQGYMATQEFAVAPLGGIVTALEGLIPDSEHEMWVERYLRACEFMYSGGLRADGSGTPRVESVHYINGNRECGEHEAWSCAAELEPDGVWPGRLNTHWAFIRTPPQPPARYSGGPLGPGGMQEDPLGRTHGEVNVSGSEDPTLIKLFLREHHGGSSKSVPVGATRWGFFNIGSTVERDATEETVDVNGEDAGYSDLAAKFVSRSYLTTGHPRYLRMLNGMANRLLDKTDRSTWVVDGTYGSRHCANFRWNSSLFPMLKWRGGRTDITDEDIAATWNTRENGYWGTGVRSVRQNFTRDDGYVLGAHIQSLDNYPRSW